MRQRPARASRWSGFRRCRRRLRLVGRLGPSRSGYAVDVPLGGGALGDGLRAALADLGGDLVELEELPAVQDAHERREEAQRTDAVVRIDAEGPERPRVRGGERHGGSERFAEPTGALRLRLRRRRHPSLQLELALLLYLPPCSPLLPQPLDRA